MNCSFSYASGLLATMVLSLAGCASAPRPHQAATFRQPAEFEPTESVWMSAEPDDAEFMQITIDMVKAVQPHAAVTMMLPNSAALAKTREMLSQAGVRIDEIEFLVDPLATFFMRDGAVYLVNDQGGRAVLDFKWSTYGLPGWCQQLHPDDSKRAADCAIYGNPDQDALDHSLARAWNAAVIPSPLFLENATIEVNGKGVLLISEPLALERNPGRSRNELERELLKIPGVTKVIWLGEGAAEDPLEMSTIEGRYVGLGAGGHTDEFVRFADPNTILLAWVDEDRVAEHPLNRINHERMQRNYDILARSTDQNGKPFRIIRIPMPSVIERPVVLAPKSDPSEFWNESNFPASEGRKAGDEVIHVAAASYLNLLIANQLVLVPSYTEDGTPAAVQDQVSNLLQSAFPGRTIQFIHVTPLNWHGGGPHCATLSVPRLRDYASLAAQPTPVDWEPGSVWTFVTSRPSGPSQVLTFRFSNDSARTCVGGDWRKLELIDGSLDSVSGHVFEPAYLIEGRFLCVSLHAPVCDNDDEIRGELYGSRFEGERTAGGPLGSTVVGPVQGWKVR